MLKLYNSLTKKQEEIKIDKDDVRIYLCGPTVQSSPHLGHGRSAVVFDFFIRYLKYLNYSVLFARNITDIDDKIIEKSKEKNISYRELGDNVWKEFVLAHENLNCLVPDIEPRATAYIPEIIKYIEQLVHNGFGYVTSSGVYYDVSKFEEYLKLSGRSIEDVRTGTRVETEDDKKRAEDFALWKFSKENEPSWDSPWGDGRPGWHIECSTMISETLGQTIDFHCGGIDLIFPHHENEIAQSTCCHDKKMSNFWLHNGFINFKGEKMSKSLGNTSIVNDLLSKHDPAVLKYSLLTTHYRQPLDFSNDLISYSENIINKWREHIKEVNSKELDSEFVNALLDDLNTPKALMRLQQIIANIKKDKNNDDLLAHFNNGLSLLGLNPSFNKTDLNLDKEFIENMISRRQEAKKNKDFELADKIRDELFKQGIVLEDTINGTTWKKN